MIDTWGMGIEKWNTERKGCNSEFPFVVEEVVVPVEFIHLGFSISLQSGF